MWGRDRPEPFLPLVAAFVCSLAAVSRAHLRVPIQVGVIGVAAGLLLAADRSVFDVLLPVTLLSGTAFLADALADDLVEARRAEAAALAAAVRRNDLLSAIRELPPTDLADAAAAAGRTLRSLGFDAAGVGVIRRDDRLELYLDGMPETPGGQHRRDGVAGRAIAEDRTIVVADYQADPDRLAGLSEVGSAVVVPIRVDGRPAGAVMGARHVATEPAPFEVEVVEVVAAHLGVVMDMDARLRRQRELLERMSRLDRMRTAFVSEVSDELRHPLTVIRGISETLLARDVDLRAGRREQLLHRMTTQTDRLRATIDALLDFSGFQASRPDPRLRPVALADLLDPVARSADSTLESLPPVTVEVDVDLVRHALELLVGSDGGGAESTIRVYRGDGEVRVELDEPQQIDPTRPGIVRTLAAQLLVLGGARYDDRGRSITLPCAVEVAPGALAAPEAP